MPFHASRASLLHRIRRLAELAPKYAAPIITQLAPGPGMPGGWPWFRAEEYHQKYFEKNPGNGYCRASIPAKIQKLQAKLPELLK